MSGAQRDNPGRPRKQTPATDSGAGTSPVDGVTILGLDRGLQLLALFDRHNPEWNRKALVDRTGFHKSTVYRILRTMEQRHVLGFDPNTGCYHLGPAMYRAAFLATAHSELARVARPHLEHLAESTGETATLAVESDDAVIVIERVLTSNPFKPVFSIGEVHGFTGNSHGKVFLAFKTAEEQARLLAGGVLQLTPNTLVDLGAIKKEVDRIRAEGVAYDLEEESLGFCGVSAPVWGPNDVIQATLSVVAPRERFGYSEQRRHADALKAEAAALSKALSSFSMEERPRTEDTR